MPLEALPDELLLHILSYLPSHSDAASLSCQCRQMHRVCDMSNRRKYRRVKLRGTLDFAVAFKMLLAILKTPHLGQYVRYLELNRSPSLDNGIVYSYKMEPPQKSLRASDLRRLKQAIHNAGYHSLDEKEMMLNILLQDPATMEHHDPRAPFLAQALAALLVSVSPALESLSFSPLGSERNKWAKRIAEAKGQPLPTTNYIFKHFLERIRGKDVPFLQNLKKARFLVDPDSAVSWVFYQPYDLYECLNLVRRLPSLKSISVDAIADTRHRWSIQPPPLSANYTSIIIRNSMIDSNHLACAIDSAKRLEEFTYAIGGRAWNGRRVSSFDQNEVFRALFRHRDHLQHLDLDVEADTLVYHIFRRSLGEYSFYDISSIVRSQPYYQLEWAEELEELNDLHKQEEMNSALGSPTPLSLRSFPQLKNLSLGIHLLYFFARGIVGHWRDHASFSIVDHLPPNLEFLRIYGYKKGMKAQLGFLPDNVFDKQLQKLMKEKDEKLPRLTHVEGIDKLIKNAETVKRPSKHMDEIWVADTDDEWTDYDYLSA